MAQNLDVVTSDTRMDRLVGEHEKPCAMHIWLLQLRKDSLVESRVLYGHIAPSTYRNDAWSAPREDAFKQAGPTTSLQVLRISLFSYARTIRALLGRLLSGTTLEAASDELQLKLSSHDCSRFGNVRLGQQSTLRPTLHLPSRDYYQGTSLRLSPMNFASADSSAITNLEKSGIFHVGTEPDRDIAKYCVNVLERETGMKFSDIDSWRLGDIELLVYPSLDDDERPQFNIDGDASSICVVLTSPMSGPESELQVRIRLLNDGGCFHTHIASLPPNTTFPARIVCKLPPAAHRIVDACEVDIDAIYPKTGQSHACMRWGNHLVDGANISPRAAGDDTGTSNDWLYRTPEQYNKPGGQASQEPLTGDTPVSPNDREHSANSWVAANRRNVFVMTHLLPRDSMGFHVKHSKEEQIGRLEFVEWLRELFSHHRSAQITWLDPSMDDIGINLVNQYGVHGSHYLVLTEYPEEAPLTDWTVRLLHDWGMGPEPKALPESRIDHLKSACRKWASSPHGVRLRVIGIPSGEIHDRIILIRDTQLKPVAGYYLSNSLQRENENLPLVITAIPDAVLRNVTSYIDDMIARAFTTAGTKEGGNPNPVIFDSVEHGTSKPKKLMEA
ncbi:VPA1262 family protein [Denitratisoma oestradiolicum]|uniref:Uncharacterized protein n=1 Tax=Denitratisoma oestradiolicum TaxID=311182 RepID=A0A6S6XU41_9PROT|nr:VPA1262 family protein [Denitratisoma oestradiolicum]TWO78801.1 hypothetical protein CBW56_18215 [Denitratisoma oestradiolicum]CAB1368305.1 protein of unknown function [Denitratisoma oestradiolicum]